MTPGSTIATRTLKARISWARHSLVARIKRETGLDLVL